MIKGLGAKPPSPGNYAYEEFSNDLLLKMLIKCLSTLCVIKIVQIKYFVQNSV